MAQDGKSGMERRLESAQLTAKNTAVEMLNDTVKDCKGMPEKMLKNHLKRY